MAFDLNMIGATIGFDTYSPETLGNGYRRVQVLSVLDYQDAIRYEKIDALHATIIPRLPAGTSPDYTQFKYLKLKFPNGEIGAIGLQWIIPETMAISDTYRKGTLVIEDLSIADEDRLRRLLTANDFKIISFTTT